MAGSSRRPTVAGNSRLSGPSRWSCRRCSAMASSRFVPRIRRPRRIAPEMRHIIFHTSLHCSTRTEGNSMKLYYSPGACSLAAHITLAEAGLSYSTKRVDLKTHTLADGTDYYTINPKGYAPVLELDDGSRLSEAAVIVQYIADRKPGTLAPAFGSMQRYRLMEWLNFIATEVHKNFSPFWHPIAD